MGLFDRFKKRGNQQLLQPNIPLPEDPSQSEKIYNSIDRRKIPSEELDRMQKVEASETYCNLLRRLFFSDYPEMPYISKDRELYTDWIEQAKMFPNSVISKKMMTRFSDDLLPGHVYMLYWLNKYSPKRRIPSYFEYEYGIDFIKELDFLRARGYLNAENKPTQVGLKVMRIHYAVIDERHPRPKNSGASANIFPEQMSDRMIPYKTEQELENIPKKDFPILESDFAFMNVMLAYACKLAKVCVSLVIDMSKFVYGIGQWKTFYEWYPFTPSGKSSKYPLTLHFAYAGASDLGNTCFGELEYKQDGNIGKARIIFWHKNKGYFFYFGQAKDNFVLKKVETTDAGNRIIIYKE